VVRVQLELALQQEMQEQMEQVLLQEPLGILATQAVLEPQRHL
jgi:hypothetical protein